MALHHRDSPLLEPVAADISRATVPTSVADKDQEAAPREGKNAVAVAIARLPVRQRLAFALRKLHDFDYEGIERMLGCPKRSARGCVIRAFRNVSRMRSVKSALGPVVDAPREDDADAPRWRRERLSFVNG